LDAAGSVVDLLCGWSNLKEERKEREGCAKDAPAILACCFVAAV